MARKITQKRKFKGGSSGPKRTVRPSSPKGKTRAPSRKRTARTARTARTISQVVAPETIFKEAKQRVNNAYEGDLSQECLNILEIQRQTTLDFLKDLEDKLKQLEVNKRIEVRDLKNIIEVNKTFVKESTKREKEWIPAELALKISKYIGKKINYTPVMDVIRKFLIEQGEPLQRGLYKNSQVMAEKTYDANVFNNDQVNDQVNALGRPLFLSRMGVYVNQKETPLVKTNPLRSPRRKLVLSRTPYENANV